MMAASHYAPAHPCLPNLTQPTLLPSSSQLHLMESQSHPTQSRPVQSSAVNKAVLSVYIKLSASLFITQTQLI